MNDSINDNHLKSPINNQSKDYYNSKYQANTPKVWNQMQKGHNNIMQESYYNGSDWRYQNYPTSYQYPQNYSSATYYFNNNAYHCVPSCFVYNYQNQFDMNYFYYPVSQYQNYQHNYRGSYYPRNNNRNYRRSRGGGKQYVYNVKNNVDFTDDGEYIDDNIIDMENMKDLEIDDKTLTKDFVDFSNRRNSPTNEELCQSTTMLLGQTTERARGYLNLYNHISYGENIQP